MRLKPNSAFFPVTRGRRSGYTLVEILVATVLTLMLMTAVVSVFGGVGDGISKSRRATEQFDRMRTAVQQLRYDLAGVTVSLDGHPSRHEESRGYFEIIEGGIWSIPQANGNVGVPQAVNSAIAASGVTPVPTDFTVGERGDVLMFTTRNAARPFVGRYALGQNPILQSDVAEVAWFLRGTTLHRRVLLVAPGVAQNPNFASQSPANFFQNNDISVRLVNGKLVPNNLSDLTKRENRFAHAGTTYPFDVRAWGFLGLPTLAECSDLKWMGAWVNGTTPPANPGPNITQMDYWNKTFGPGSSPYSIPNQFQLSSGSLTADQYLAQDGLSTRLADDVVLNNVIGFDVKVWEPAANTPNNGNPGYVDLGYTLTASSSSLSTYVTGNQYPGSQGPTILPRFQHWGIYPGQSPTGSLAATATYPYSQRVYDSGSFHYENEGYSGASGNVAGKSTNGFDNDVDGVVNDFSEWVSCPPYPVPLRGIQIKIRCFEPDSRQIREMTIEQDFLPK